MHALSDYERVGGRPTITAVVDRFHEHLVADERLAPYLAGTEPRAFKQHQTVLVSEVLGGPAIADCRAPRRPGWDVAERHFGQVVSYLVLALQECGVDAEVIARLGPALVAAERDLVCLAVR